MDTDTLIQAVEHSLSGFASPKALLLVFLGAFLVFGIVSWILVYHWQSYSVNHEKVKRASRLYFSVSAALLIVMLAAIFMYMQ